MTPPHPDPALMTLESQLFTLTALVALIEHWAEAAGDSSSSALEPETLYGVSHLAAHIRDQLRVCSLAVETLITAACGPAPAPLPLAPKEV